MATDFTAACVALAQQVLSPPPAGGIWFGQVPEAMVDPVSGQQVPMRLPVLALDDDGEQYDWTFEPDYVAAGNVTWYVFAVGYAAASAIALQIHNTFNTKAGWANILIDSGLVVSCLQTWKVIKPELDRSFDAELVFRAELPFEYRITGRLPS